VAENALAGVAWCRADVNAVIGHATGGLALARRYRLGQLEPALLVCEAAGSALRGDTAAVEQLLAQARALGQQPMETIAALTQARATCAYALDHLATAARHLDAAAELARADTTTAVAPMLALHPLVRTVAGAEASPVEAEMRSWNNGASRMFGGMLAAAEAVRAGRRGSPSAATTLNTALGTSTSHRSCRPWSRDWLPRRPWRTAGATRPDTWKRRGRPSLGSACRRPLLDATRRCAGSAHGAASSLPERRKCWRW
jgi:hypothetical protein